jgi:hypothetical protein
MVIYARESTICGQKRAKWGTVPFSAVAGRLAWNVISFRPMGQVWKMPWDLVLPGGLIFAEVALCSGTELLRIADRDMENQFGGSRIPGKGTSKMNYAMDVKVNVKPVFSNMVHTGVWEGPCRVGTPEELEPAHEIRVGREQFAAWRDELECNLCGYARILEPVLV